MGPGSHDSPADEARGSVRIHEPVLLPESIAAMELGPDLIVVDATVGAGGHALAFARKIGPGGLLVGLDRDAEILTHEIGRASCRERV